MERTAAGPACAAPERWWGKGGTHARSHAARSLWLRTRAPNLTARWAGLGECIMQALSCACAWWIGGPPWDGFSTPGACSVISVTTVMGDG